MHSRSSALAVALGSIAAIVVACHSSPPPPPPAPPPALSDSGAAALKWVEPNAVSFRAEDSVASARERSALMDLAAGARVIGFSEMTEGTHQFAYIVRRSLIALADSSHVRALAIQAPMAETMDVDRYVRTGVGDPQRLMRALTSWRWETREVRALIEAIRAYNRGRSASEQIGVYGFEIPSAARAVQVVTSLRDSVTGPALKAFLARQYACVALNEGAHWGLEGRTADSSYWNACGPATTIALDSIVALRTRVGSSPSAAEVAYAEQMARLIQHHVRTSLQHLARQNLNAEHVLFLADMLPADAKLMLWGGDVEMGRLTLDKNTVQTAVPLGEKLGSRYRAIAYAIGDGVVRARPALAVQRSDQPPGLADLTVRRPLKDTFEDVFIRDTQEGFWLDMRALPNDLGGAWLRGPRSMRLIIEQYSATAPEAFETPIEFPKYFDAVVFVRHVTAAKQ